MNPNDPASKPAGQTAPAVDAELLNLLCCPETRQALTLAAPSVLEKLNQAIAAGTLQSRNGKPVREKIEGGLIRTDGKFLYPIRYNIPIMLVDESIPLAGS
jgi:uncharacterized protein YbaR (Trm112 family)